MNQLTAAELDRVADELLALIPRLRAAAKAMRAGGPKKARVLAKKVKRQAKAAKKKTARTARKVSKRRRVAKKRAGGRGR